jgi:hypothetical protein
MYLVRFSYDLLPANREKAVALIRREVDAAKARGLKARLLVPLTRGRGAQEIRLPLMQKAAMKGPQSARIP